MGLIDAIKRIGSAGVHNAARNVEGAFNTVNPFDNGKGYNDAWKGDQKRSIVRQAIDQGTWNGQPGADQELIPYDYKYRPPAPMPRIPTGVPVQSPYAITATPLLQHMQNLLHAVPNTGMQPNPQYQEDDTTPGQLLQPLDYSNGQVSQNGMFLQGSLPQGVNQRRFLIP